METKIVYVVTSDNKDYYLEQTYLSICSVRKYNNNVAIELVVDRNTDKSIVGTRTFINNIIDRKIVVDVPECYNKVQTSRYMKTSLREYISGDYLFIDSDTIITTVLDQIDDNEDDVMAVINEHVPISNYYDSYGKRIVKYAKEEGWLCSDEIQFFNSGVMYVKDTEIAHRFYSDWHEQWKRNLKKFGRHFDQPPLAFVNEQHGYLIKELPGIWNCQILRFGLPFIGDAKIIHYFAAMYGKNDIVYAFRDNKIYHSIRENGCISTEISNMIDNANTAFVNPTRVSSESELSLLSGDMCLFCVHHPNVTSIMNFFFRQLTKIISFIKRK